ncbi:phage tail tape measure protein [Pantoea sp. Al-1710]|uniref:Phage tail tape measure protein n=1 Tax=Candidatus Pantoea communis TaxID=2608354 RepID=A0ABX0RI09_9GAMM|nr:MULTISPECIES: phage tail tape measure protein [Pantoea]NIG13026.1 phage tail tape measure protein [Pantoea sp. Cy-640]NIG17273.1 phage tail tape measure protein [Pantoea communis]
MAARSLGTLTIDLIAKVGGFVSGLNQSERAADKWRRNVKAAAADVGAALAGVGVVAATAAAGIATASIGLVRNTADQITETDRWAKSLKISTQTLLQWQYAAKQAGIAGDQISDIFKDINDKVGDAVLNQSGDAAQALDTLGLSAQKLQKLSPDKILTQIGDALNNSNISQAGKTNILESLVNDGSRLLPLLEDNNKQLNQFKDAAKDYGLAPSDDQIQGLVKVSNFFRDLDAQVEGLKTQIATGLAQVDLSPLQRGLDQIRRVFTDPQILQGLTTLVGGVAKLVADFGAIASRAAQFATLLSEVGDRFKAGGYALYNQQQANQNKSISDINLPTQQATFPGQFKLDPGQTNQANQAAKQLASAYSAATLQYQRMIATINTSAQRGQQVTELQKLNFNLTSGNLKNLNEAQKTRLRDLATEVDRLNAVKKANQDNLAVQQFITNLQNQNQNANASNNVNTQGFGLSDTEKQRLQDIISIRQDYLQQQQALNDQQTRGDIDADVYKRETAALSQALQTRISDQQDYYKKIDALQSDWLNGAQTGFANWVDSTKDISSTVEDDVSSAMSSALDNVNSALEGNTVSWKQWSVSVLEMIEKVAVQAAASNLFSGSSGLFSSAISGISNFFGASTTANAKGGVYGAGLSAYSNSIVSTPTMFRFASGAGLMGEDGPEAIIPLQRAADGSLGVKASGFGQNNTSPTGGVQVNITISDSGSNSTTNSADWRQFGNEIGRFVDERYKRNLARDLRDDGDIGRVVRGKR